MFQTSGTGLAVTMTMMLSQIAMASPDSVCKLMAAAGITHSAPCYPTRRRSVGNSSRTTKRRRGKKRHHRQKR